MRRWFAMMLAAGCYAVVEKPPSTGSETPSAPGTPTDDPTDPDPDPDPTTDPTTETMPTADTGSSGGTTTPPGDDSVQQLCVDEINRYRDTLGLYHLDRWTSAEACSDDEARQDSESGIPHGAFGQCGEWAQNECPDWWGSYEAVTVDCLAMMWAEGPGPWPDHGHYINMSSTSYTRVACGFYTTPGGSVWALQNFQ